MQEDHYMHVGAWAKGGQGQGARARESLGGGKRPGGPLEGLEGAWERGPGVGSEQGQGGGRRPGGPLRKSGEARPGPSKGQEDP